MAWTLDASGRWCHHASTGGDDAHVQRTADGRRWFASVNGAALHPAGRAGTLLTWESSDGARAHVERVLRNQRGGPFDVSAFRGRSRAGETLGTFAPFDDSDDEER